jgi:EAL domain-containing protein (putative c-di-GMP-specific phosphodiesterase class I)
MDRWVVSETARLAADGHAVEFNLSAKSVADPHMLSVIQEAIREFGAPPQNMVCEITETALVHDIAAAESFVRGLNDLGCRVALDDFGAGYGGFAYLKRLPVSYLKIDQQFVRDLCAEESSRHVISAVVNLAKAFGMKTIAEGAEDDATLRLLKDLGVDHVQGFVIGRPSLARDALEGAATAHATSRSHHGARVTTTSHD